MHLHLIFWSVVGLLGTSSLHAQVLRCVDAKGHVTYTNSSSNCPTQAEITEVQPALTAEEQARLDAQYQQALERKRREQELYNQARQSTTEPSTSPLPANQQTPPPATPQSPAEPAVVYVPTYPPRPPHIRPPRPPEPPQPPTQNTANCNVFRCYDGKGNTWSPPH